VVSALILSILSFQNGTVHILMWIIRYGSVGMKVLRVTCYYRRTMSSG